MKTQSISFKEMTFIKSKSVNRNTCRGLHMYSTDPTSKIVEKLMFLSLLLLAGLRENVLKISWEGSFNLLYWRFSKASKQTNPISETCKAVGKRPSTIFYIIVGFTIPYIDVLLWLSTFFISTKNFLLNVPTYKRQWLRKLFAYR
jgi:hypothetical protein